MQRGPTVEVPLSRTQQMEKRFDEILRVAKLGGDHVWTAIASWYLPNLPDIMAGKAPALLDAENMAYGPDYGCFRCEEPYSEALAKRRCKGD